MKQIILIFALLTAGVIAAPAARSVGPLAPKRAAPTLEQRVANLEAYVNNGARGADNTNNSAPTWAATMKKPTPSPPIPAPAPMPGK